MSFSQLPYELQETIITDQDKSDLTSLCLVSKSFLEIARPLLYRSLKITFFERETDKQWFALGQPWDPEPEDEDDAAGEGEEESDGPFERYFSDLLSRQAALLRIFDRHSEWKVHVKEVEIVTNAHPDQEVPQLCRLFSSFTQLQRLELFGEGFFEELPSETFNTLATSCPKTIRSLHMSGAYTRPDDVRQFLEGPPDLNSLTLPRDYITTPTIFPISSYFDQLASTATRPLALPRLKTLKIVYPDSSILYAILHAEPSLDALDVKYNVLPELTTATFTSIRVLVISGQLDQTLVSGLVSIFKGCTSLQSLKIVEDHDRGPNESLAIALTDGQVLHQLPPTLQKLYLFSSHFEHSYLLDWISSTAAALKEIIFNRFALWSLRVCSQSNSDTDSEEEDEGALEYGIADYDVAKEEEVETICRRRQVHLTWIRPEDD